MMESLMRSWIVAIALGLCAAVAQAKGVPFAVGSLEHAQQVAKQESSKHVLVFFTSET
jgi:hypothetical protein